MEVLILIIVTAVGALGTLVWGYTRFVRSVKENSQLSEQSIIQQVQIDHLQIYKTVVENSPDLFVTVDQSLQVIMANKTAVEYGLRPQRLFDEAKIAETSKLHFGFELKRVIETGLPTDGEIRLVQLQQNNWKFFLYHIFPIRDADNVIIGAVVSAIDVTAQRDAEIELSQQMEFIKEILNALPDAIYVKDEKNRYIYGNSVFSNMVGKNREEFIGKTDQDIYDPNRAAVLNRIDEEILRTNKPRENDETYQNLEGRRWNLNSKRKPFQFHDGRKVMIAIMRDFSERKKLEAELQISRARQEEAARLATLGETASSIAHEINNPLSVLMGIAELIQMKITKYGSIENSQMSEYSERIVKYSLRIAKIIKGLRDMSRDASEDPFEAIRLDILIDESLEMCRHQMVIKGIDLKIEFPEYKIFVEGRFAQLSQIFMNLVNNARDAVDGDPHSTIKIEILAENETAKIRVQDSGEGVPVDIEDKIMNAFFTTKPVGKGTGLGLSISRAIAMEHKGSLILNREIGNSCFELQLPVLRVEHSVAKKPA